MGGVALTEPDLAVGGVALTEPDLAVGGVVLIPKIPRVESM